MHKGALKIAPLLALGLMGYLTGSVLDVRAGSASQGKGPPSVSRSLLHPALVTPQNHASPAGRDPFEVGWASYLHSDPLEIKGGGPDPKPAGPPPATPVEPGTTPVKPVVEPIDPPPAVVAPTAPPLPAQLTTVLIGDFGRMAIIDGRVYHEGDTVTAAGAADGWVVESMDREHVALRFGDVRRTLDIVRGGAGDKTDEKKTDGKR
jgi:hypothetical protein